MGAELFIKELNLTEDELCELLVTILNATPGITYARGNCGTSEFGIDILFQDENTTFKTTCFCGIQLKVGNIGSGSGSEPNFAVKEIIGQLAVAFGHEFMFGDVSHRLNAIYVITTGEISPPAQEYIKEAIVGIRNLKFIYGQKLEEFLIEGRAKVRRVTQP